MLKMGAAGFSNTLCSNSNELSLKQAVKWSRIWHNEGMYVARFSLHTLTHFAATEPYGESFVAYMLAGSVRRYVLKLLLLF